MNLVALRQARVMLEKNIDESPSDVILMRSSTIDNGFGELVPNPLDTSPTTTTIRCRIAHDRALPELGQAPSGLSTNLNRMITTDWATLIVEGDTITESTLGSYRVGPVDPLMKFGGVIGYQAPLTEA